MNNYPGYTTMRFQRGYGLGSVFKRFFTWLTPLAKDYILPNIKSGLQSVGSNVVNAAANIAQDVIKGRNLKESYNEYGGQAIDTIKQQAEKIIKGEGKRKRKKKHSYSKKNKKTKKQIIHDIFN